MAELGIFPRGAELLWLKKKKLFHKLTLSQHLFARSCYREATSICLC